MAFLTQGQDAFFIALFSSDSEIVNITNVGIGTRLTLHVYDKGGLLLEQLNELTDEIVNGLSLNFGIELKSQIN